MKKNQRNQEQPDPSGRLFGPFRTYALILPTVLAVGKKRF